MLSDRLGYELLVAAASIAVGGVEKIDADLARPPDRRDPRGAVGLPVERVIVPQPRPTAETSNCPSLRRCMLCLRSSQLTVTGLILLNRVNTSFANSRICPFPTRHVS